MRSHIDMGCEEALRSMLRPDIQGAIAPWMSQVGETEKRSILRLVRMANPAVVDSIGHPRSTALAPRAADIMPGHWKRETKKEPVTLLSTGKSVLSRSASGPSLSLGH
mmetsp:Transcript_30144/g.81627  ORF Transcript_30144/g.81627 Transcript_30144/m.81627 type:complete len:108 (-) Transcript_30144:127-450(-)|eukprot:CAMPEP_0171200526 /NCGR_PEP_ID=MMETSP0790-20130122/24024_1 /TAXON_ID=2925 /ORGANISM="Alexandrium catenella, Strain OF101" /LENGTH=107 /DNA_ID=CAMNT_0011665905 /DNA_START=74 /DNA_END=397 /DNA_ORIENTATION=-